VNLAAAGPPGVAWLALLAFVLLPLGAEILFRGLVHGVLAGAFSIQRAGGPWFVSWPALLCGGLYAPWGVVLAAASVTALPTSALPWDAPVWGSVVFGVACALARERSESLALPVFFHALCIPLALLIPRLLP
jgi:membrane protease YdiL (CAAX protease family)